MAFEFLFDEKTYQVSGKYLYSGLFNGFLATGGLFFFTAFLLFWPITTTFTVVFAVTTTITTLAAVYLLFRDDSRNEYLQAMNEYTRKIKQLYDEIQYYEDKLQREQTLLQTPETELNPHKCIKKEDLDIIEQKIAQLKKLYDETRQNSLPKAREKAEQYTNGFIQRHIIGVYKAFINSYVFYLSFPLFIALAVNAIVAPAWLAPLAIPLLVFAVSLGVIGLFQSYVAESRAITTYDAAIKESIWIENSAKKLVESCENLLNDRKTSLQRLEVESKPELIVTRKNSSISKDTKYFVIKKENELRTRIPLLNHLSKPLGERLPKSAFELASPNTLGKKIGWALHRLSEFFYQWTIVNTVVDFVAKLIFMAIMGAIVPGGVALYLKFVLGITFTPLMVNIYIAGLVTTTVASIVFSFFNAYWNQQEALLKTYADHVTRLTLEVTEDLKLLNTERASLYYRLEASTESPAFKIINKEDRQRILDRKQQLEKASRKLRKQSEKMNEDNFFMSLVKWVGNVYNSITTGYAWYMGFPLFVFLTLVTFVPITTPVVTVSLFVVSLYVGVIGMVFTFDAATNSVEATNEMINEATTQSNAADELLKHFDKPLQNKDLSTPDQNKYRLNNETAINLYTSSIPQEKLNVPIKYTPELEIDEAGKFDLLRALRCPEKPKHQHRMVDDLVHLSDIHVAITV
ncbi:MAG: hypothetical protein K2X50_08245 [Gammaproteobacteria bacterium]|nr:hypothetical protein [Gammaproteobacteria bacterium]